MKAMYAPSWTIYLRSWLNSQLEPTGHPRIDGRIRASQIQSALRFMIGNMLVNIINVIIVVAALWRNTNDPALLVWGGLVTAYALRVLWKVPKIRRHWQADSSRKGTIVSAIANSLFLGTIWGLMPAIWFPAAGHEQELLIATVITGMIGAGAFSLSSLPLAAFTYVVPMATGAYIGVFRTDIAHLWPVAFLLGLYSIIILYTVHRLSQFFIERTVAEEATRERGEVIELLLREFQENGSDWLYELDDSLKIVSCSPRMSAVTRMSKSRLLELKFTDLLCPEDRDALLKRIEGRSAFHDFVCRVTFGDVEAWWSLTASPILDRRGRLNGWRGVGSDITERKLAEDRIVRLAQTDALTGLYNRSRFREVAESALADAQVTGRSLAIGTLDLDYFKEVNDTLGHAVGDALLKVLAERLLDLSDKELTIGRIGGDEFGIILHDAGDSDAVNTQVNEIIAAVCEPIHIDGNEIRVGGTIGIAMSDDKVLDVGDLIRNSDLALYFCKTTGRGRACFYNRDMHKDADQQRVLREDLRKAISEEQLRLEYQPVIDAAANRVVGFEALLRWDHPDMGALAPDRFIGLAETAGLIGAIGEWTLKRACHDAMTWPQDIRVAVNISPVQLGESDFAASVRAALEKSGLPANRLELEITEAVFMRREMMADRFIGEMNRMGVAVALDDFGTGYCSLSYLTRFSVQKIKIDRSFVSGDLAFRERNAIISAVVGMARTLDLKTTVEGVETAAELAWLTGLGCREFQGFYFAGPMDTADVAGFIDRYNAPTPPLSGKSVASRS